MTTKNKTHRWRPLLIGTLIVLFLSALITYGEPASGWGRKKMWLLTVSGLFAELAVEANLKERIICLILGTVNLLALFSYVIHPSKTTKIITVLGFIVWQLLGLMGPRMGI